MIAAAPVPGLSIVMSGFVVSMTISLLYPSDQRAHGWKSVRLAALPMESVRVAPFATNQVVLV